MRLALRWIPTEVWVDVFIYPWKSRKELGEIVHRFKNRKFVEILQYCLHDRGKRTLGLICLNKGEIIPRTPMPENIKSFNYITIIHFDSLALDFLRQISPLFTDVNMWFDDLRQTEYSTILEHLAPLIHGIHSLTFRQSDIPLVQQHFAPKLAQIKMLTIKMDDWHPQPAINFALNWLTSEERDPAEPRLLEVYTKSTNFQQICTSFRQQFLSAKHPCTFAIKLSDISGRGDPIAEFHLENDIGEQLHGEYVGMFRIVRHQSNAGTALQEWIKEIYEKSYQTQVIWLDSSTIGPLDANADANEVNETGEEKADQPSTSEKA